MGSYGKITQGSSSVPSLVTLQNAATANGNGTAMDVTGYATAILQVAGGSNATISFDASLDGTNYYRIYGKNLSGDGVSDSSKLMRVQGQHTGGFDADPSLWLLNVSGLVSIRAVISAYSSGSITVKGSRSVLTHPDMEPVFKEKIFSASNPKYTVPATPTEMITFYGATATVVHVLRVELLTEQTTVGTNDIYLHRRSTAASGGTANAVAAFSHDSRYSAGAAMNYYTANPTPGTSVSKLMDGWAIQSPAAASHVQPAWKEIFRAQNDDEAIVLRSSTEGLAFNFNGAALPAGFKIQTRFTWKERSTS